MPRRYEGYRLTPAAARDLDGIWAFSASRWSPEHADRYIRSIINVIELITEGDVSGRDIPDIRPGYLKADIGSHFVFYRIVNRGVQVVRILHKRMDHVRHL